MPIVGNVTGVHSERRSTHHPERRPNQGLVFKRLRCELIEAFAGAKVGELGHTRVPQEDVGRFDVTVNHWLLARVQVVQALENVEGVPA